MRDTLIQMKDGRSFCGPIWEFKPKDGYLTIPTETDERLYFRDMDTATTRAQRVHINEIEDVDMIERARDEGWDDKI